MSNGKGKPGTRDDCGHRLTHPKFVPAGFARAPVESAGFGLGA